MDKDFNKRSKQIEEELSKLTPEEREAYIEKWHKRNTRKKAELEEKLRHEKELKNYYKKLDKASESFKKFSKDLNDKVKDLNEAFNKYLEELSLALEKHTGEKYNKDEVLSKAVEIFKGNGKEEVLSLYLSDFLEEVRNLPPMIKEALKNYPISGHLIDAKLRTTKGEINEIIPRIELSTFEDKVVNSLIKSLYQNSDKNKKSESYYLGNGEIKTAKNGNLIPQLIIKPQQLYKEITGKKRPNGKDVKEIRTALDNLSSKNYPIEYRKKVGKEFIVIRNSQPLLNFSSLARFNEEENSKYIKGNEDLFTKKEAFVISFNPIFSDQIKQKYILYPTDLEERITLASPKRVKTSTNNLRDYLLRGLSSKKYSQQIYKEKLEEVLNISHQRKARREALIKEALEVCNKVELLESYSTTNTSKGVKYLLKLNKDFIK